MQYANSRDRDPAAPREWIYEHSTHSNMSQAMNCMIKDIEELWRRSGKPEKFNTLIRWVLGAFDWFPAGEETLFGRLTKRLKRSS